jgi:hypothetical protein
MTGDKTGDALVVWRRVALRDGQARAAIAVRSGPQPSTQNGPDPDAAVGRQDKCHDSAFS